MPVNALPAKSSKLARTGWGLLTFLALGTGLGALRYALPNVPSPAPLPNFHDRHGWLIAHAVFSSLALLTGPWQFLAALRRRSTTAHQWMGRIYCGAVLIGWITSVPIASHAQTGLIASVGFLALGAAWIGTTAAGYCLIRRGRVAAHRKWMIRSYALTAAAITLRLYLPVMLATGIPFGESYPFVAWFCWIPNLLFVEWLIARRRARVANFAVLASRMSHVHVRPDQSGSPEPKT